MQLLNLLNDDYPPEAGAQLCERVLATLTALLAGNVAAREHLSSEVGYDTLLNIVLRRTAPTGPSGGVLRQLLHLVLEVSPLLRVMTPEGLVTFFCLCSNLSGSGASIEPSHASVDARDAFGVLDLDASLCHGLLGSTAAAEGSH